MPLKKMRVEVFDETGNKYKVSIEGNVTRKSALRILDMVELLGGIPAFENNPQKPEGYSKIDKVRYIIEKHFLLTKFSAGEAQSTYIQEMGEQIDLSTISTYLSRLSNRGILIKEKDSNKVLFRLVSEELRNFIKNR
jgi:DNA-binding transcriptional ArsR family regulator